MSLLTIFYAVLFYVATLVFVVGLTLKIRSYAKTPAPLRIPTTPAPMTSAGVGWRMAREVVFFESLFKSSKWTWIFGWTFHAALLLVDRVRYISTPSDHLMLALLLAIGMTGLGMRFVAHTDIVAVKAFMLGLMRFDWQPLPADPVLLVHLALVALLMFIFPISKLLHAPGLFFSPTRNQADNARELRHVSAWAATLDKRP
ncbi:MAG: nitrate reductase [Polaromonas sp.]|nr:nitrate reductase [Polaromonas sp.]